MPINTIISIVVIALIIVGVVFILFAVTKSIRKKHNSDIELMKEK